MWYVLINFNRHIGSHSQNCRNWKPSTSMWGGWSLEDGGIIWKKKQWWITKALDDKDKPVNDTKAYRGDRGMDPLILNFSNRSKWVLSFKLCLLYSHGNNLQNPFNCGLFGPHNQSGQFVEEKSLVPTGNWTMVHPASSITFYLYITYVTSTRDMTSYLKKQMHTHYTRLW